MSNKRNCLYCGVEFEAKRNDHYFCCAAHVAAYYRANPNPDYIHAEKQPEHVYYCEYCGIPFQVNDYANRAGQRTPKYCSPKHKQAAYRARGKATQEQAKRRYSGASGASGDTNTGSTGKTGSAGSDTAGNAGKGRSSDNKGQQKPGGQYWDGYKSRWEAARMILNVSEGATAKQLRKAWMDLLKKYHPDVNPAENATAMTQKINWAYEYLSKP